MALIVETGAGLSNADSYASVSAADDRLAALGMTNWADLLTEEKEQALRRATEYMEQAYRTRWRGTKLLRNQALSWPRYGAIVDGWDIDSNVVPADIAHACIDLAFKGAAGDLNADQTRAVIREKVGPLETEYDAFGSQSVRYRAVDMMLAPYLLGGGSSARLLRA